MKKIELTNRRRKVVTDKEVSREFAGGASKRRNIGKWITEGARERVVAGDAESRALKRQDMQVSEKRQKLFFVNLGGNTVDSSQSGSTVFFVIKNKRKEKERCQTLKFQPNLC